jgi:hypothetical protein
MVLGAIRGSIGKDDGSFNIISDTEFAKSASNISYKDGWVFSCLSKHNGEQALALCLDRYASNEDGFDLTRSMLNRGGQLIYGKQCVNLFVSEIGYVRWL